MSECGFCHGRPVGNAATWVDGKERPPAACPRCGRVNLPEDPGANATDDSHARAEHEDESWGCGVSTEWPKVMRWPQAILVCPVCGWVSDVRDPEFMREHVRVCSHEYPTREQRLREALGEARPYVFNRTQGDDWRAETATDILARVDAALSSSPVEEREC